jgi:hypothetical protein
MIMPSPTGQLTFQNLLIPLAWTTTGSGAAVDLQGYTETGRHEMIAYVALGAAATASTFVVSIESNPTTSLATHASWAAVTTPTTAATASSTSGSQSTTIRFTTNDRYVRAKVTVGTTATTCPICAVLATAIRFTT